MRHISFIGIGSRCGVTSSNLEALLSGKVSISVAGRLGVTSSSLQAFVDGGTSISLAGKLGISSSNLQELRKGLGKEGAIGLIIGLMVERAE